jgi:hypothetical protein
MDEASVARRRRPPTRIPVLHLDEWETLERTAHLLGLVIDGLERRGQQTMLEPRRDLLPLQSLALDLHEALQKFERKVGRATLPVPTRPAELTDLDRQPT